LLLNLTKKRGDIHNGTSLYYLWQASNGRQPDQQIPAAYKAALAAKPPTGAGSNRKRPETDSPLH